MLGVCQEIASEHTLLKVRSRGNWYCSSKYFRRGLGVRMDGVDVAFSVREMPVGVKKRARVGVGTRKWVVFVPLQG